MKQVKVGKEILKKQHYQLFMLCNKIMYGFEALAFEYTEFCGVFKFALFGGGKVRYCSKASSDAEREAIQELERKLEKLQNVRLAG